MTRDIGKEFSVLTQQLGPKHAKSLQDFTTTRTLLPGAILIQDKAEIDSLYLVLEGALSVSLISNGRSLLLGRLGQGKWVGDVSLLSDESVASSAVTAESAVTILELKHATFHKLAVEQPDLACALLKVLMSALTERIRRADESINKNADNQFSLAGSEKISREKTSDKGWLKSILQKLSGVEAA